MAMSDTITQIRTEKGLTQEQMARDLFVTRQAISRWETGETSPSIDMVKLICVTYSIPLERFFEMPAEYYCQCCSMPIPDEALHGTEADGSPSDHYCKWCYQEGDFTAKGVDMESSSRLQPRWKLMRWVSRAKKRFLSWPRCSRILIVGRTSQRTETEASVIR